MKKVLRALFVCMVISLGINLFWLTHGEKFSKKALLPAQIGNYSPPPVEILNAFLQPYHYLGKGKQAIAFESQDAKFVLKFFTRSQKRIKRWYTHPLIWLRYLSPAWIFRWHVRSALINQLRSSYSLAHSCFQKESGLLFLHFYQSRELPAVLIFNQQGMPAHLDLNHLTFVLQEKAELLPERIKKLQEKQSPSSAEMTETLAAIYQLLKIRSERGLFDSYQLFHKNFGFVGQKAIQIDVGKLRPHPDSKAQIPLLFANFKRWVTKRYPSLKDQIDQIEVEKSFF